MYKYIKRIIDLSVALVLLAVLSPLMVLSAILIAAGHDGPILFKQKRPGKNGKIFTVYKFRTMSTKVYDESGRELSDFERMTKVGRLLRKTSVDELPQLLNIIRGDMSFIGPRPLLTEYLELYSPEQLFVSPRVAQFSLIDSLYVSLAVRRKDSVVQNIQRMNEVLRPLRME